MIHERIYLDESDKRVYIDTYVTDVRNFVRDAMLVLPGGGYTNVCQEREGEPIALAYLAKGYNAFVLNYRVGEEGDVYPKQLIDAARAVLHIKRNAQKYNVNPERVFAVGFSAGGHLAGSLALMYKDPLVTEAVGASAEEIKVKGVVLSYPVVSALHPTHEHSFMRLAGKPFEEMTEEEKAFYSLENHVTPDAPAAFIWHTATDRCVPPYGSIALATEYIKNRAPMTLRLYPYGIHGISLANKITSRIPEAFVPTAEGWLDESVEFLETLE